MICTSPRSGSTLLCKLLAATGVAGNPEAYFHRPSISDWFSDLDVAHDPAMPERELLVAIFRAAIAKGSLDTGIFGLRLQRHSFGSSSRSWPSFIRDIRTTSSVSERLLGERSSYT